MNNEDHIVLQSLKHENDSSRAHGWIHHSILTYTLCAIVIAMSSVALIVNANAIEQAKSGVKHRP